MAISDDKASGGANPLTNALGKLLGGSGSDNTPLDGSAQQDGSVLGGLVSALVQEGGLNDLLAKLNNAGLGDVVDSWLKPGENTPLAPDQLQNAAGNETIDNLASKAGVSSNELLEQLSQNLPGIVDKLTPDGKLPNSQQIASWLGSAFKA